MSPVRFGAVQVNQASKHGSFVHLRVTVTGSDRDAFKPNLAHFDSRAKGMAGTDGSAWTFTVGVGPNKGGVRIIPGHASRSGEEIFAAFGSYPVYGGPRANVYPIIKEAESQIGSHQADVKLSLKQWLC